MAFRRNTNNNNGAGLTITPGPRTRGSSSFAASASKQLNVKTKTSSSSFGGSSYSSGSRDRMLAHYNNVRIQEVSWKDRKAKRPSVAVTDAEVQAAIPKTRLQLTNQLRNDGVLPQADLRSTTSSYKPPTQIGSNLRPKSAVSLPSSMSDKSLLRLASDPIRSLKYGSQLKGFSQTMDKRINSRQMSTRFVENDSLKKLERRMSQITTSSDDYDGELENYFDAEELRAIKDITNVKRVLDSSQEFIAEEVPKTQDELTADWLFAKDSSFIKSYWRKDKELFKKHTKLLDHRMKLEDAIEVAAEIGDVDILESLLDSMKTGNEIDTDLNKRIEDMLSGSDSTSAGMFGKTPLHKAAYRGKYDMVRLLLKLGCSPNSTGTKDDSDITPLDACVFGMSIIPPEYGRNVTAMNRLEYFEDHFRCILYLIAAGSNPMLSRFQRLRGGFFYHLIDNMLRDLKVVHANQISDPLQYGILVVLEAFWIAGYRINEDVLDDLEDEYTWLKKCSLIREMIRVKKCETSSLKDLARNAVRCQITTSLTYNQVPRYIPYALRRPIALPEIYNIPL